MDTYCKLFRSIITSSIWQEPLPTRIVWITILVSKDQHGFVEGSVPGLAHIAGVGLKECEEALERLSGPDKYSRTQQNEGRRIKRMDGGWMVLNHEIYRDKQADHRRDYNRRKQAEYRKNRKVEKLWKGGPPKTMEEKLGGE